MFLHLPAAFLLIARVKQRLRTAFPILASPPDAAALTLHAGFVHDFSTGPTTIWRASECHSNSRVPVVYLYSMASSVLAHNLAGKRVESFTRHERLFT